MDAEQPLFCRMRELSQENDAYNFGNQRFKAETIVSIFV